ncbi:TolC family protein [Ottowia testudinis]|uniref:TolC family protein n=1 Tax=Ottowia testudinis TaxID=2816950 RepID=A0A975CGG2_9BURK|nr:TolC family protein [Ottowia testudinis]QTD45950.1 TolC family protein [Ottowia testudinis]
MLLAACAQAPVATSVALPDPPARWAHADAAAQAGHDPLGQGDPRAVTLRTSWWAAYGDAGLQQTVAQALASHGDLASAALKIRNAELRAEAAGAAALPTMSGSVGANASRPLSGNAQRTTRAFSASVGVSWELDLWGKLRAQSDMAAFERDATWQDRRAVTATLAANVVRQYWQLAALNQRIAVASQSLAHARRTLDLTQAQYDAGAVSGLDVTQSRQATQSQELNLLNLRQQRTELRHALALLLDLPPADLPAHAERDALLLGAAARATIAPGLPAEVLACRPDLRAAELRLRSALTNVDAVRLSFYPGISLTGGLGTGSAALLSLLSNPVATLGVGLSLPFLNMGEMRRNPQIAQNDYEQAVIGFRQSLLRALGEVENHLSAVATLREAAARQTELVAQARRIDALTEVRFRAGAVPLRTWLDAQEARRQSELAQVDAELNLLQAQANLFQALGTSACVAPSPAPR